MIILGQGLDDGTDCYLMLYTMNMIIRNGKFPYNAGGGGRRGIHIYFDKGSAKKNVTSGHICSTLGPMNKCPKNQKF